MEPTKRIAVAYVPVLHAGYFEFFRDANASALYLVGADLLQDVDEFDYVVRKDALRALPIEDVRTMLVARGMFDRVEVLTQANLAVIRGGMIVMPNEDISRWLAKGFFAGDTVEFIDIFLRWHRDNTNEQKQVHAHRSLNITEFDREIMRTVVKAATGSHDWWRQVAAALVVGGEVVLMSTNKHLPHEQCPNVFGDPRAVFRRGVEVNLTTAAHAEISLVAAAARQGLRLEGATMFVTDFPCPFCARMLVQSGITKLYFSKGYAMLDGEQLLKDAGIELISVSD